MNKLYTFLEKYATNDSKYTHIIKNKKYFISNNKHKTFIKLYTDLILQGEIISVFEKHKEYGPVYIEFIYDMKYFNESNIKKIVIICNNILKKYLSITSFMMESYILKTNKLIKIFYPFICIKPLLQKIIINDLININTTKLIKNINLDSVYELDLPLYKSTADEEIIHIFHLWDNKIFDVLIPGEQNHPNMLRYIIKILSIRKFMEENVTNLKENIDPVDLDFKYGKINTNNKIKIESPFCSQKVDNQNHIDKNLNDTTLIDFLAKYKANKGEEFTHTSMSGGSWNIPDKMLDNFYYVYSKEITHKELQHSANSRYVQYARELHMTERHRPEFGPIVIDFDFKFKEKIMPRPINKKLINKIIAKLTEILSNIFGEDGYDNTCFVLQRPNRYKKKDLVCDGLHIQFPNIVCEYMFQFVLRDKFINEFELDLNCENKLKDVYDEAVIKRNNWCMYLSTKPGIKPYQIVGLYNCDLNLDELSVLQLVKILSIRNKTDEKILKPKNYDAINDYIDKISKYEKETIKKDKSIDIPLEITENQEYDERLIRKLLNMLSKERVDTYYEWIKIGMILHYCHLTDKDKKINYFNLWDKWCKVNICNDVAYINPQQRKSLKNFF
jgi:hypothetical protein